VGGARAVSTQEEMGASEVGGGGTRCVFPVKAGGNGGRSGGVGGGACSRGPGRLARTHSRRRQAVVNQSRGWCGGGTDGEETRRVGQLFGPGIMNSNISELNRILSKVTSIDLIKDALPMLEKSQ
jgi:hypothetical protein